MPKTSSEGSSPNRLEQNRIAQRTFRQRRRTYLQELEQKARELDGIKNAINVLRNRINDMEILIEQLTTENMTLKLEIARHARQSEVVEVDGERRNTLPLLRPDYDPLLTGDYDMFLSFNEDDKDAIPRYKIPIPCKSAPPCPRSRITKSQILVAQRHRDI